MSTWSREERSTLRSVVEVARRELRDREPEAVPARLTKVAKSSARSLPPPLEQALVTALVDDADFRGAIAERYDGTEVDDPIGVAFLDDPERALTMARSMAAEAADEADRSRAEHDRRRVVELEAALAEAKERVAAMRRTHEAALADLKERDRKARANLLDEARTARDALADVESLQRLTVAERDELRARVDELTTELANERERRRRAATDGVRGPVARVPFAAGDPASLARHLDTIERTARPYRGTVREFGHSDEPDPLVLPAGVAPDLPEVVDALVPLAPDLVLIDGYNLAGAIDSTPFHTRAGRDRVMPFASALRRSVGAHVVVVFDATAIEGRSQSRSVDGIEVVFAQDRSADDEIVAIVASSDARTVVVTNDRELRERSAGLGALAVWSDAVVAWANR